MARPTQGWRATTDQARTTQGARPGPPRAPGPPYEVRSTGPRATLHTHPVQCPRSEVPPAAARLPNPSLKVPGTPEEALQRRTIFTRYSLLYIHDLIVNPKDYN